MALISSFLMVFVLSFYFSSASMMIFLVSMTAISSFLIKMIMLNEWSSILLFLALVGGLMILFSFFMSTIQKEKNSMPKFMIWPYSIIVFSFLSCYISGLSFPLAFSTYTLNSKVLVLIMVILLLILSLISKIIMNPKKPFKSIN